jgi:hypothetical protein
MRVLQDEPHTKPPPYEKSLTEFQAGTGSRLTVQPHQVVQPALDLTSRSFGWYHTAKYLGGYATETKFKSTIHRRDSTSTLNSVVAVCQWRSEPGIFNW